MGKSDAPKACNKVAASATKTRPTGRTIRPGITDGDGRNEYPIRLDERLSDKAKEELEQPLGAG